MNAQHLLDHDSQDEEDEDPLNLLRQRARHAHARREARSASAIRALRTPRALATDLPSTATAELVEEAEEIDMAGPAEVTEGNMEEQQEDPLELLRRRQAWKRPAAARAAMRRRQSEGGGGGGGAAAEQVTRLPRSVSWGGQGCTEKGIEALLAQASGHARRQSVEGLAKAQQALARALQLAERDLGASHATTL